MNVHHFIPSLSHGSESARWYAARMLGIESAEQVTPFLLDSLGSADPEVRRQAARTLGELRIL